MLQLILLEKDPEKAQATATKLSGVIGADIKLCHDVDSVLAILEAHPFAAMVLVDLRGLAGDLARVERWIATGRPGLKLLPFNEDSDLIPLVMENLGISPVERQEYMGMKTIYLHTLRQAPCDIYTLTKDGPSNGQYVKSLQEADIIDLELVRKYEDQGFDDFHVLKEDFHRLSVLLTEAIIDELSNSEIELEDAIRMTANAHELVREYVRLQDLDDGMFALSRACASAMEKTVENAAHVSETLFFLLSNRIGYAYQQAHLVALLSHHVLGKQKWYSKEHLRTLCLAAFYSDVTLESSTQMLISSMDDLKASPLSDEEKLRVIYHAKEATDLVRGHVGEDSPLVTVLLQSHGKKDGMGLEADPNEELAPLSKVFLIVDAFVKIMLNPDLPSMKKDILEMLTERFTYPTYRRIIKALETKIA